MIQIFSSYFKIIFVIKILCDQVYCNPNENIKEDKNVDEFIANALRLDAMRSNKKYTIEGPRCIPLVSKNINANPYHESLLSLPGSNVRRGFGMPKIISNHSLRCEKTNNECRLTFSINTRVTLTDSFSVSFGNSNRFSKQYGFTNSRGQSNSITNSIENSIENALSKSLTTTDEKSLSKQLSDSMQKTHDRTTSLGEAVISEKAETNTLSQDTTTSNSTSSELSLSKSTSDEYSEINSRGGSRSEENRHSSTNSNTFSVEAGVSGSFFGVTASVSTSYSSTSSTTNEHAVRTEENWNNQLGRTKAETDTESRSKGESKQFSFGNGKSNARTNSFSSSATKDNRVSDIISLSREASFVNSNSESNSESDTNINTNAYRVNDAKVNINEMINSTMEIKEKDKTITNGTETTKSHSMETQISQEITIDVPKGTCKEIVCQPSVISVAIPYECIEDDGSTSLAYLEYMILDKKHAHCSIGTIDCSEKNNPAYFSIDNQQFTLSTHNEMNTLDYGQVTEIDKSNLLILYKNSSKGMFTLKFEENGNLVLKKHKDVLWDNKMGYLDSFNYSFRLRINEKGHLVQEAKHIFTDLNPFYRKDEWITVWSSVPINYNVTIGIPKIPGDAISYKLILEDNGDLKLYDAVGAVIWCVDQARKCKHRNGYKFPEVYLVPTNFKTPQDPNDNHNRINGPIRYRKDLEKQFYSLDNNCSTALNLAEGIRSPNGRFKLILENTGNLLIKDNFRTMWESATSEIPRYEKPFKLILTPTGNLMILDANRLIVWSTRTLTENVTRPCRLELLDKGLLVVIDSENKTVWHSWPGETNYSSVTFFTDTRYVFRPCHNFKADFSSMNPVRKQWNFNNNGFDLIVVRDRILNVKKPSDKPSLKLDTYSIYDFLYGAIKLRIKISNLGSSINMFLSTYFRDRTKDGRINLFDEEIIRDSKILTNKFYDFTIVWMPDFVAYFVDNKIFKKVCNRGQIPQRKMYIVLEMANSKSMIEDDVEIDYLDVTVWNGRQERLLYFKVLNDVSFFSDYTIVNHTDCELECRNNETCVAFSKTDESCLIPNTVSNANLIRRPHFKTFIDICELNNDKFFKKLTKLSPGESLTIDTFLVSTNENYVAVMQEDGDFVVYRGSFASNWLIEGEVWNSGTQGHKNAYITMQDDGNLVIYDEENEAVWASHTLVTGSYLKLADNGKLVIYGGDDKPIKVLYPNNKLLVGQRLVNDKYLVSSNGKYAAIMQESGDFVLCEGSFASTWSFREHLWSSDTYGNDNAYVTLQNDGNLVIYSNENRSLWSSNTQNSANYLILQDDGTLALYNYQHTLIKILNPSNKLLPGRHLTENGYLLSSNGRYCAIMQIDSNFVLYDGPFETTLKTGRAIWQTQTYSQANRNGKIIMQDDGNLVIYGKENRALWDSRTFGGNGNYLELQNNGKLAILNTYNQIIKFLN